MPIKRLIMIDGASGTGKSDLLYYFADNPDLNATIIKKLTTRKQRPHEKESVFHDLYFPPMSYDDFKELSRVNDDIVAYRYGSARTGENFYGVSLREIREALTEHDIAFVIIRNKDAMKKIKTSLPNIECTSVFMYTDIDKVSQRLLLEGYSQEELGFRLSRLPAAWGDYVAAPGFYDHVIVNNSSRSDFHKILESFIADVCSVDPLNIAVAPYVSFKLPKPLVGFRNEITQALSRTNYHRNVFLMMKFRSHNKPIYEFIKDQLGRAGFNCIRADELDWDLTHNVYNPVAVLFCCKFGIALFDEPEKDNAYSPNVAYELGMMHSQLKDCLILKHESLGPSPFDLVAELHSTYRRDLDLQPLVKAWVDKISRAHDVN